MSNRIEQEMMQNSGTSVLIELQRLIYGQRTSEMTPLEIYNLFQEPITSEFNLTLYLALQQQKLNPNITILQIIPRANSKEYLIPIALCLRFGTDPNLYVNAPKLGIIHIMGYIYYSLGRNSDKNILNTIVLMFLAKGTRPSLQMFDANAGKIRNPTELPPMLTTLEWINNQGYQTILNQVTIAEASELQKYLDAESLASLSLILDMTNLINRPYQEKDMTLAIRAFSKKSIEKIPRPTIIEEMDYKSIDDAVTYLNFDAFDYLVNQGCIPSYLIVNTLLVNMRAYKNMNNYLAVQSLEKMLISSVSVGVQLDSDQLVILSTMNKEIISTIVQYYEQPQWLKLCRVPGTPLNESLKKIAVTLNLDTTLSSQSTCRDLSKLSAADKTVLIDAARRRQQLRLAVECGTIDDFIGGNVPNLTIRNASVMTHSPFDYNDIDISYYKDDQGAIWGFTSDKYRDILEGGVNPYNSTILPDTFKEQLKYKLSFFKEQEDPVPKHPLTFAEALNNLTVPERITDNSSEESLRKFMLLSVNHGISTETIRTLSKEQMARSLRVIGFTPDLAPLSTSHAFVTTARIVNYVNQSKSDLVKLFFDSLNLGRYL